MLARILSSAILLPGFISLFFMQDPRYYLWLVVVVVMVGFHEYRGMLDHRQLKVSGLLGGFWILVWLLHAFPNGFLPGSVERLVGQLSAEWFLAGMFISICLYHLLRADLQYGVPSLWADLFAVFYFGILGVYFIRLKLQPMGGWWTFVLFAFSWMYDAGAYFVGRSLGRTPLSPLSPSKTVEGVLGGVVISLAFAAFMQAFLLPASFPLRGLPLFLASVAASLLAQAGDLAESMLKRYASVKDSGWFLKLGGLMDKMDSPLFIAPFLFWLATH